MNVKTIAKFAGQAAATVATVRTFSKARREHDKLRMLDAVITAVSIAVTVAIVVREIRENRDEKSRLIDLEDV
ncbi:MAG TPA: hypothetical protein VIP77_19850 [Jiangellaceae bacterium]